jgi:hypothetical protein
MGGVARDSGDVVRLYWRPIHTEIIWLI